MKFRYEVPDYEHSGDLEWAIKEIKSKCPQATSFKSYEERDFEQECEAEDEYGELDEYIYQGFVEFEAPEECLSVLDELDCYQI